MELDLFNRIVFAIVGAVLGALVGYAGWWLYGLAYSLVYDGPGMDPVLRHWLQFSIGAFAAIGLVFRESVVSVVSDTFAAIFQFESGSNHPVGSGPVFAIVIIALVVAAIWFSVPSARGA